MLINNTHIVEALGITHKKASSLMLMVLIWTKVRLAKPTNNPRIKLVHVKHFDIDEAIEAMSSIRPTRARTRIVGQLKQIKEYYE